MNSSSFLYTQRLSQTELHRILSQKCYNNDLMTTLIPPNAQGSVVTVQIELLTLFPLCQERTPHLLMLNRGSTRQTHLPLLHCYCKSSML